MNREINVIIKWGLLILAIIIGIEIIHGIMW